MIPPQNTQKHVLLVEPNDDLRETMTLLLQCFGYQITSSKNANEALALALSQPPDVVLTEVRMIDMEMHDLCQRLRALPNMNGCRIVAFTGDTSPQAKAEIVRSCFDAVLVKPSSAEALVDAIG
ncbi:response regulator [Massilia sp. Bi118]|jgi:CheY-like chemotaxis protein|uniref:response regulator n=1 Tax=Massilia sp. Bi118 TaxID=2822346 RepID=UPI0035AB9DCA